MKSGQEKVSGELITILINNTYKARKRMRRTKDEGRMTKYKVWDYPAIVRPSNLKNVNALKLRSVRSQDKSAIRDISVPYA
jgi:hypothetical protein